VDIVSFACRRNLQYADPAFIALEFFWFTGAPNRFLTRWIYGNNSSAAHFAESNRRYIDLIKKARFNLISAFGSDEEPQDLDGERHEDFEGHIRG
jgi:hypothetical protein